MTSSSTRWTDAYLNCLWIVWIIFVRFIVKSSMSLVLNQSLDYYDLNFLLIIILNWLSSSAEELGISEYITPYKSPSLQPGDLLKGVNFASGGSGYDSLTAQIVVNRCISFHLIILSPLTYFLTKVFALVFCKKNNTYIIYWILWKYKIFIK